MRGVHKDIWVRMFARSCPSLICARQLHFLSFSQWRLIEDLPPEQQGQLQEAMKLLTQRWIETLDMTAWSLLQGCGLDLFLKKDSYASDSLKGRQRTLSASQSMLHKESFGS